MTKLIISLLVSLSCVSSALAIDTSIERTPKQSFVPSITTEPVTGGGPQFVSADIDLGDPVVSRSLSISRGPAVYATSAPVTTQVSASATVIPGPLLRAFTVQVPAGSLYDGEIRNFKW